MKVGSTYSHLRYQDTRLLPDAVEYPKTKLNDAEVCLGY